MRGALRCALRLGSQVVFFCGLLSGQEQRNRVTVTIEVSDAGGTGIPGADIRWSPSPEAASSHLKTADNGELTLKLTPGIYTASVICAGFKTSFTRITVRDVDEIQTIPIGLQIGDTGSPSVDIDAVTPSTQDITTVMFPNAPKKARSVDCFRSLRRGMSMEAVVQKCGSPDDQLGSGSYIFVWRLADGSTVSIGTPHLEKICDVRYLDPNGKSSILLHCK
jgi:hypothetical protein